MRRLGVLIGWSEDDPEYQSRYAAFVHTYMQSVVGRLLRMPNKQLKSLNYLSTHLLKSLP